MHWVSHIVLTKFLFGEWTVWSIAPDVPMIMLYFYHYTWETKMKWTMYTLSYRIPHSIFILFVVPKKYRGIYAFHILCDIVSHCGKWSIEPLYPIDFKLDGFYDSVEWI